MKKITLNLIALLFISFSASSQNSNKLQAEKYISLKGELTFTFQVSNTAEIEDLTKNLSIVNFDSKTNTVIAWANEKQFRAFEEKGIVYQVPKDQNEVEPALIYDVVPLSQKMGQPNTLTFPLNQYPTYANYAQQMQDFEDDYPALVQKISIGATGEGDKDLLFVKISDNVATDEQEPKLMLTSSMHGDEIAGYPMMLTLIDYILTVYMNTGHPDHQRIKNLVENAEIWINPSANPDGTYYNSASNTSVTSARRANANNVDLNRNYPDNVAGIHPDNNAYQTETLAFMALADAQHFVISANFHGGTELVNYPFDNAYTAQYTHPDTDWFEHVSVEYATHAQNDANSGGTSTPTYNNKLSYMTDDDDWDESAGNSEWHNDFMQSPGVTHGAEWYRVYGGRQDYMTVYKQSREVTIELSDIKILPESSLVDYWYYNRDALLDYLTQGTYGFTGVVKDNNTGNPIEATVTMVGHDNYGSYTFTDISHGDFYRPIKGGTYDILIEAPCYQSVTLTNQTIADAQKVDLGDILLTAGASVPSGITASIVGSTSATIDWNSQTGNTFNFRYREVGTPTWTTITGLTPNTIAISGLSVGIQYEAQVQSICGALPPSAYSSSIYFTTQINYCSSSSSDTSKGYITNLTLNTINNNSTAAFYSNYTTVSTDLTKNNSYNFSITKGANQNQSFGFAIWIDYNQDGDFLDTGENVANGASNTTYPKTGSFTIDNLALNGNTRMRVSIKRNGTPSSCEAIGGGEVEDYTVNIIDETLGVEENALEGISIYPNPFSNVINMSLPPELLNKSITINLFDLSGRRIINLVKESSSSNTLTLDNLTSLSSGTYILKIMDLSTNKIIIKKVIK